MTLALLYLGGCATNSDRASFDASYHWGKQSTLVTAVDARHLCASAKDPHFDKASRSLAVARLFASYVKPGFTSAQIGLAFPDFEWLKGCSLRNRGGLGGLSPVYTSPGEVAFELRLFPDDNGATEWIITFVLPESPEQLLSDANARAFLTGALKTEQLRLVEFSIFHPVPLTTKVNPEVHMNERITRKGVGIMILPSAP